MHFARGDILIQVTRSPETLAILTCQLQAWISSLVNLSTQQTTADLSELVSTLFDVALSSNSTVTLKQHICIQPIEQLVGTNRLFFLSRDIPCIIFVSVCLPKGCNDILNVSLEQIKTNVSTKVQNES